MKYDFAPGKVCYKPYWFCVDYLDMTMWVHGVDGSFMFVGFA
jgi:hypothetical protein